MRTWIGRATAVMAAVSVIALPAWAATAPARAASSASAAGAASRTATPQPGRTVIVIGLPGLRWTDISATATPAIWRLASAGSVGSLVTTTGHTTTCPDDAWLTLNAGDRAAAEKAGLAPRCPPLRVVRQS